MKDFIFKLLGFNALIILGDPTSFDRFLWLKHHLKSGHLKTLDAGCGSGSFTIFAAKIGNDALGISFDKRNNEVALKRASY